MATIGFRILKKFLIFSAVFFGTISCCHKIPPITNPVNSYPEQVAAQDSVIFIIVEALLNGENIGATSSGTGFGVAYKDKNTVIMTAGHVCDADSFGMPGIEISLTVTTVTGESIPVKSKTIIDKKFDLCIFQVEKILPIAKLADYEPISGDSVKYAGYPAGVYIPGTLHYFDGYMGGIDIEGNHMYNIPTTGGASGSPIYNTKGEIVALVSAVLRDFEHITFAIGLQNIKNFLEENKISY